MQRRSYLRVRLRLPARLRWTAALGQRTEVSETINVSRSGVLVTSSEAHSSGQSMWVTFPFDLEASAQPETLARVVRCERREAGELPAWKVAMQFADGPQEKIKNGLRHAGEGKNGHTALALPIRVRPAHVPWYEEAMTVEVSPEKLKFVTNREYRFGELLLVAFAAGSESPWSGDGEWETEITGIEMQAGRDSLCVTVRKKN